MRLSLLRRLVCCGAVFALTVFLLACSSEAEPKPPESPSISDVSTTSEAARDTRTESTSGSSTSSQSEQALPSPQQPRPKVVTLDPGHGGPEIGPVSVQGGHSLSEKDSNMDMAYRLRTLLVDAGYHVVLTRDGDVRATGEQTGPTQFPYTRFDLQRRIDIANEFQSNLFISIHSNGSPSAGESGIEVWWEPNRPWGADNERIAQFLQRRVVDSLAAWGYRARDRGLKDNSTWRFTRGRYVGIFVIAPPRTETREEVIRRGATPEEIGFEPGSDSHTTRALNMPGALIENLFLTHTTDATILRDPGARDAIALGMRDAIEDYFNRID